MAVRVVRLMIVLTGVLAAVAGCSYLVPISAVALRDGAPVVVMRPCGTDKVMKVSVAALDGKRQVTAHWWVTRGDAQVVTEVRLLQAPPGWQIGEASLTEIQPGVTYQVDVSTDDSGKNSTGTPVRFTLADLATLGSNQVWSADNRAVSRQDFLERAKRSCR